MVNLYTLNAKHSHVNGMPLWLQVMDQCIAKRLDEVVYNILLTLWDVTENHEYMKCVHIIHLLSILFFICLVTP
jgi:hypothetical protein